MVAGLAGLLKGIKPDLTSEGIKSIILSSVDNIDAYNPGYEDMLGAGQINVYKAITTLCPTLSEIYYTGLTNLCEGQTLTLSTNACTGCSYAWKKDGSIIGTSPTFIAGQSGTYTLRLTRQKCYSEGENSVSVFVNPAPATPDISVSPSNIICNGQSVTLSVTNCNNGTVSWSGGFTGASINASPTVSTNYQATCDLNGCRKSSTTYVTAIQTPVPPIANSLSCATTPTKVWEKKFGGNQKEEFNSLVELADGGLLWIGVSSSPLSGDKTLPNIGFDDLWVIKTDAAGNKLWEKVYGGSAGEYPNAALATTDGGAIITTFSYSGISGDKTTANYGQADIWTLKIDANGIIQQQWTFGGTGEDLPVHLIATADGNYLLSCLSYSPGGTGNKSSTDSPSYGDSDIWVIKFDPTVSDPLAGAIWQKTYGGSSTDAPYLSTETSNGDILIAAYSKSNNNGNKTAPNMDGNNGTMDYWVLRITSATGNLQWDKSYGGAKTASDPAGQNYGDEIPTSIVKSSVSGRYIIGGLSKSQAGTGNKTTALRGDYDGWLVEINESDGSKTNEKTIGGANREDFSSMVRMPNGNGYWVVMRVANTNSGDITATPLGMLDFWVAEIDNDLSLAPRWDRRYGGAYDDSPRNYSIGLTKSGELLVGGIQVTQVVNTDGTAQDYFAVRINECSVSTAATICAGTGVTLYAGGCAGNVSWSNGMSGNTITVTVAGTYTAICTSNGANCLSVASNSVIVTTPPAALTLSGSAPNDVKKATQTIASTQTIPTGSTVIYQAGSSISLLGTFQAQTGSIFKAEIKGCN